MADKSTTPARASLAVRELVGSGKPLSELFELARADLPTRSRLALDLVLDGSASSTRVALEAAGYSTRTATSCVPARTLKWLIARELGFKLQAAGRKLTSESYRDDLHELAHADPAGMWDDQGQLLPLSSWPKPLRRMVKSLKIGLLGQVESVTFDGRGQVLTLLGKHRAVGAFDVSRVEHRTYVIRDYTGQARPAPSEPQLVQGERLDQADDQADQVELPSIEADQVNGSTAEPLDPRISPEDIDRGFIPVPREPGRPADAEADSS